MAATSEQGDSGNGDENVGVGCSHEDFKEIDEVKGLINSLPDIYNDQVAVEASCERFIYIVDQYQEQPHLIDPHLEGLLTQLLNMGRNVNSPTPVQNLAFKYLYLITKMRGAKVVVRLFPHEVVDVEPILSMLARQDPNDHAVWETRYILLLWLSMACMIPFDLSRLDSNIRQESGDYKQSVMDRILDIGKMYLTVPDKSRDAAAYLMSRFMTRPDVKREKLGGFLDWVFLSIEKTDASTMIGATKVLGLLTVLGQMIKHGKREDLLEHAPMILDKLASIILPESSNTMMRKMGVKVIQRLGLTFLKNRIAAWRYQRGSRSLAANLQLSKEAIAQRVTQGNLEPVTSGQEEEEAYDIPEEIEDVIEQLLTALKDKDTIVRWSAAKGIGRITGRLPKELADEVVGSLMDLFSLQETDGAWHGGCLTLAELGRRGLLLPHRLPDVVPVVLKALAYDERRGNFSVGAHVRDAACYVCWAFARAYEPVEIKHFVNDIASALIVASIFDREVNVRKAASAAFQENVGRQGTFPHGIDILTVVDYFAVGNRTHCYLELSVFVAQYKEYTDALIDHLAKVKVSHWDSGIRELCAKALHNLTEKSTHHVSTTVLPDLIGKMTSIDLHERHGALLAVAEITHALSKIGSRSVSEVLSVFGLNKIITGDKDLRNVFGQFGPLDSVNVIYCRHGAGSRGFGYVQFKSEADAVQAKEKCDGLLLHGNKMTVDYCLAKVHHHMPHVHAGHPFTEILGTGVMDGIRTIVTTLQDGKLFRGMGGELMRKAVSCLIEKASLSKLPFHDDPVIDSWQAILDDCLNHTEPAVQMAAVSALPAFFTEYYMDAGSERAVTVRQEKVVEKYIRELQSAVEVSRMGHSLALGALPRFMLSGKLRAVMGGLVSASQITDKEQKWAESRRDALKALTCVCRTVGCDVTGDAATTLCSANVGHVYEAFLAAMRDYTLDSRGDVGAWVREASMTGLHDVTSMIVNTHPELLQPQISEHIFKSLIQQSCEKIDRTRAHAGGIFEKLLYHSPPVPHIPHFEELKKIFAPNLLRWINWGSPASTFPMFTKLLDFPVYSYSVLLGLTVSVGGLTESLVKHSSSHLHTYLRNIAKSTDDLTQFTKVLTQIFKDYQKVDRVSLPMLRMLDQLLSRGCFDSLLDVDGHPFPMEVFTLVKTEISRSGDPQKILASADVFCGLLLFPGDMRKKSLTSLAMFLCHRYPRVRKTTANKLYEMLVTYEDIAPGDSLDEVMTVLSETLWDNEIAEVRPIRNKICELLNIPVPVLLKKTST